MTFSLKMPHIFMSAAFYPYLAIFYAFLIFQQLFCFFKSISFFFSFFPKSDAYYLLGEANALHVISQTKEMHTAANAEVFLSFFFAKLA